MVSLSDVSTLAVFLHNTTHTYSVGLKPIVEFVLCKVISISVE